MKKYEHISILPGNLTKEEVKKEIEKYENFMKKNDIKINSFEDLGLRKLAYEIRENKTGNYLLFKITCQPEKIAELEQFTRNNENTIKFIDVRIDVEELEEDNDEQEEM